METLRNCTKTCMEWCKNLYASVQTWAISALNKTRQWLHNMNPLYRAWILTVRVEPWPTDEVKSGKERLFAFPYGITFALSFGRWSWTGKPWNHDWPNPNAKVFRCPVPLPGFFVSVKTPKGMGGYIGLKPYFIDKDSGLCRWMKPEEYGALYLHPSATIRKTVDR